MSALLVVLATLLALGPVSPPSVSLILGDSLAQGAYATAPDRAYAALLGATVAPAGDLAAAEAAWNARRGAGWPVVVLEIGINDTLRRPPAPTLANDLLAALLANAIPPHQDAEGTVVNPVPGSGSNDGGMHSSVTVEGGDGQPVTVNVTQVAPQPATKDRAPRTAYERALVEVYRALGAEGVTFAKAYAQHKGTKEIVFTAWQEGRAQGLQRGGDAATHGCSPSSPTRRP